MRPNDMGQSPEQLRWIPGDDEMEAWRRQFDPTGRRSRRGRGPGRGPGRGRGGHTRGRRVARGDVRAAVLALLADEPMHGYQVITELEERTHGAWKPSPGSVYPTLQMLSDEELVRSEAVGGRNVFHLTDEGRSAAEAVGPAPWEAIVGDSQGVDARRSVAQIAMAFKQVAETGTPDQVERGRVVLNDARKALYGILAEDVEGG